MGGESMSPGDDKLLHDNNDLFINFMLIIINV